MKPMDTLNKRIAAVLLVLGLCGTAYTSLAQEAEQQAATATETKESEAPTTDAPNNTTAAPDNNNSPFDYEASEEISQDLSVSFPVDI